MENDFKVNVDNVFVLVDWEEDGKSRLICCWLRVVLLVFNFNDIVGLVEFKVKLVEIEEKNKVSLFKLEIFVVREFFFECRFFFVDKCDC